ncbi:MAG: hypothetical protein KA143_04655, partial [Saprospiraceae bacterium]|nr:hypothetical protein [Saprospiraceae bacterium]
MMTFITTRSKSIAWSLIIILILQCLPIQVFALTGGPSQPEVETFKSIEVSDMVDPATGDFSYNIPLLEVGGYPINLIYNAGITMDQEASTVGLGWNINPGVITRSVRGIPDDFLGDRIDKNVDMKDNYTFGFSFGGKFELFGVGVKGYKGKKLSLNPSLGINYDNYNGYGLEFGFTPAFSGGDKCMPGLGASLGLTASSKNGLGFAPNISYSKTIGKTGKSLTNICGSLGTNINSRAGMKALTYSVEANLMKTFANFNEETEKIEVRDEGSNYGGKYSGSFNFSSPSHIPQITYPMINNSFTFQGSLAFEGAGSFSGGSISGFYTKQKLRSKQYSVPAYGVAYIENGKNRDGLLDFNREKDGSFTKEKPNLPIPYLTNDVFSVSGQGIGGSYQLFRGDVGVIYDKKAKNTSNGYALGVEAGLGQLFRLGADIHTNFSSSYTGKWDESSIPLFDRLNFHGSDLNQIHHESVYFKAAGEWSPYLVGDENILESTGNSKAVKVDLDKSGSEVVNTNNLKDNQNNVYGISSNIKRSKRAKRNQSISFLVASEAKEIGLEKTIKNHTLNSSSAPVDIPRNDLIRKSHHISEITALRPDGLRYVYGIPAYNNTQSEVSFSCNPQQAECNAGLVSYIPQSGIVPNHKFGKEEFLDIETTPPFAHSFLLTSIISEDYVDLGEDGPTPDDLGTYTKFNYSRLPNIYRWRIPYEKANYNPGFNSQNNDDKGNFTYGEKEIWLLHSIESKTQIAVFEYGDRRDGHGVAGPDGGRDTNMFLKKLDKITLYSLPDFNQNSSANRTPIKSVHFEYDYSLCRNVPTNIDMPTSDLTKGGKLTLQKVYFKYGVSNKGKFSPYKFTYSGDLNIPPSERGINPDYHIKGYNRWGTFAYVNTISNNTNNVNCSDINHLNTSDFSFIQQQDPDAFDEQRYADDIAGAWNLRNIQLPSGGKIKVAYEADDYGFVQDKEAMQLFEIIGTADNPTYLTSTGSDLTLYNSSSPKNYLFFNLSKPIPSGVNTRNHIYNHYVKQVLNQGDLFFKVFTNLDNNGAYEYVNGYAQIEDWGESNTVGYIKLKTACTKDKEVSTSGNCGGLLNYPANPIAKTAWQYARLNLPHLVYSSSDTPSDNADDFLSLSQSLSSIFDSFKTLFEGGINNDMKSKGYASTIKKGKSWIRLNNPYWKKLSGTHRVKKITISDEWANMAQAPHTSSEYGQEYTYTSEKVINGDTLDISSGVAAYEPIIGAEENPFRLPITYKQVNKMAPDDDYYIDGPIGESFYPGASIIYSQVKVTNLQYTGVNKKASGWTIHEFYTSKDFPTNVSQTTLDAFPKKTKPILKLLKVKNQDYMTTSQGYAIELNDMHGKQRSKEVYNQIGTKISGIYYYYKTSASDLVNSVPLLLPDGQVSQGTIGVDYSIVADQREAKSKTTGIGANLNNDNFMLGPIPVPAFVPLPFWSREETRYRSVVVNKIIHRSGVLEKTVAYDLGSTVETRNIAWDGITGEVLATQTFNEFEDPIYNFNYPAHWVYKGMQNAYKNIGALYQATSITNGIAYIANSDVFMEGDEVSINATERAWVKDKPSPTSIKLIDFNGNPIIGSGSVSLKIIRSGHRNKASTSIGSVVSLVSPINSSGSLDINGNTKIINAGAIEFDDKRNVPCNDLIIKSDCVVKNIAYKETTVSNMLLDAIKLAVPSSGYIPQNTQMMQNWTWNVPNFTTYDLPIHYSNYFQDRNCNLQLIHTNFQNTCQQPVNKIWIDDFRDQGSFSVRVFVFNGNCYCSFGINIGEVIYDEDGVSAWQAIGNNPSNRLKSIIFKSALMPLECNEENLPYYPLNRTGKVDADFVFINGTISKTVYVSSLNCMNIFEKSITDISVCEYNPDRKQNPYTTNHRGTYTPKKSYTFLAQRKSSSSNNA